MIGPVSGTGRAMMASLQQAMQKGMPPDQAIQYVKSMATQGVAPLADLYSMMNQFQRLKQQQVQPPQTPPTIKDQLNMLDQQQQMQGGIAGMQAPPPAAQPMDRGLGAIDAGRMQYPQFAGGGVVALASGSEPDDFYDLPEIDMSQFYARPAVEPVRNEFTAEQLGKMKPQEIQALGLRSILKRGEKPTGESREMARQALAKSLGVDDLNKQQMKYFKDSIEQIAKRRDEAKAMMFVQAGAQLASSNKPFLSALAGSFAAPAQELSRTRRELDAEERATRLAALGAKSGMADRALADFDRVYTARAADAAATAAEEGRIGQAIMGYGAQREQAQLQRERMAADVKRSQGQLGPLGFFKADLDAAIKAMRDAQTPEQRAAAQAQFNTVTANMQKLQPQFITGQAGINREQIRAGVTALQNAEKNANSQIYKLRNQKRLEEAKRDKADRNKIAQLEAAIAAEEDRLLGIVQTGQTMPGAAPTGQTGKNFVFNEETGELEPVE